jgi:hypothetical protein
MCYKFFASYCIMTVKMAPIKSLLCKCYMLPSSCLYVCVRVSFVFVCPSGFYYINIGLWAGDLLKLNYYYYYYWGHAVAWLRHYATRQKVAGSNPDVVDFLIYLILPAALWPWGRLSL